jgi:hypothetical protein
MMFLHYCVTNSLYSPFDHNNKYIYKDYGKDYDIIEGLG